MDESILAHIRNLVVLAYSDGSIDEAEQELIKEIGMRHGLKEIEVELLIERPEFAIYHAPTSFREKASQFYDLVSMILADDIVHENELNLCRIIAGNLGFKSNAVDHVISDIRQYIDQGLSSEEILSRLSKYGE